MTDVMRGLMTHFFFFFFFFFCLIVAWLYWLVLDCLIVDNQPWLNQDWKRIVTWFNQDWSWIEAGLKDWMSHKLCFFIFPIFFIFFWCRIVDRLSLDCMDCMDCKCTGEVPELPKSLPPPVSVHLCTRLEQDWSRIVNRNDSIELQSTWIGLGLESGLRDCRNYQQSALIEAVLDPLCTSCPHVHLVDWCRIVTRL